MPPGMRCTDQNGCPPNRGSCSVFDGNEPCPYAKGAKRKRKSKNTYIVHNLDEDEVTICHTLKETREVIKQGVEDCWDDDVTETNFKVYDITKNKPMKVTAKVSIAPA